MAGEARRDERDERDGDQHQRRRRRVRLRLRRRRGRDGGSGGSGGGPSVSATIEGPGSISVTGAGLIGLVVVALIAGGIYGFRNSRKTQVPSLVGMPQAAAVQEIKDSGLIVRTISSELSGQPPATVVRTDPPGGTKVDRGAAITIVLAAQPLVGQSSTLPNPGLGGTNNPAPGPGGGPGPGVFPQPGPGGAGGSGGREGGTNPNPLPRPGVNSTRPSAPAQSRRPGPQGPVTVTATVRAVKGSYTGSCPPPKEATTYQATITVSATPATVTYRWTSSNGGDTDPSTKTLTFSGTQRSKTVTHNESFYLPDQTIEDRIAVVLFTPQSGRSNEAAYRMTCSSGAPG